MKILLLFLVCPLFLIAQTQIGQDIDGEDSGDNSGYSVSISSDGSIVAIGALYNDGNGADSGHVRIYENQSGTWVQLGQDIDGEAAGDWSGYSVSLSSDGFIVAIGSRLNDGNGTDSGHVRIYENQSGTWVQLGQDIDGEAEFDESGFSVSLSSDGSIVAIGAILNNGNGTASGHVRIYENQSGTWVQLGDDIDGEAAGDFSAVSVSLSSDGSIVGIGASENDGNGTASGHVRIYENQSGTWVQLGQDIDGEAAVDLSGRSVRLSSDGSIVAIGANLNDGNGSRSGHVRIYENQSGTWVQLGQDIDGEASEDQSGTSISLSSDGSIVAIGAIFNAGNGNNSGHVKVYKLEATLPDWHYNCYPVYDYWGYYLYDDCYWEYYSDNVWTQLGVDIEGELGDLSGHSVSLSSDGGTVVIGAPGNASGYVKAYDLSALLSIENQTISNFNFYPNPAKDQFTIQLDNLSDLQRVNIYNNLGQLVLTTKESNINTSNLTSGLYIVEIETDKGKGSKKLIIE